ncbi:P-loop containing nucleoside triphosphate hydrolase protein [Paraphoma chrysanthemicola]|nr:P-loop containing nucleoside triphosphate hydrolase protein [Paraphoma chrysanthemicola]
MSGSTLVETPLPWRTSNQHQSSPTARLSTKTDPKQKTYGKVDINTVSASRNDSLSAGDASFSDTALPRLTSSTTSDSSFQDLDRYIALGCLHYNVAIPTSIDGPPLDAHWMEMLDLPDEVKVIIGTEAARLLDASWIRLFLYRSETYTQARRSLVRIYLLPEDWKRRVIDRNSKILKNALRELLRYVDTSPSAWNGDAREAEIKPFNPWASAENVSLYYLFNKLPSPAPKPENIKSRYARVPVRDLLRSAAFSEWEEHGEQPLAGLRTRLYPYQSRSASLMIEREAAPQLNLDPRLEVRTSPNGKRFFFGARDGSFLHEPKYYEASRGGILAETMGLGKTLISLAVILTTKGHYPQIPDAYTPPTPKRHRVGTLSDMAASIIGRRSIPARVLIEQTELTSDDNYTSLKDALDRNRPFYEIPAELPRMNRNTKVPPPRQLALCSGTIIVVPRNLLHQWQAEIKKHVLPGGLNILVVDSVPKRGSKAARSQPGSDIMTFASELPAPTELMRFDVVLFTRNRFEQEIQDGTDEQGRRAAAGITRSCNCPYIGSSRIPDCNCVGTGTVYESPLRKLHWLRIIIDEGHSFSSSVSNAVLVAKQIQAERRWVVSGTPAKNLVGVEVDMPTLDTSSTNSAAVREATIEQRKTFSIDDTDGAKATKALGSLASHFLMVRPWCDSSAEGRLEWDDYVYRHEHQYKRTYSGFSSCFLRTLEDLVVKTRPEDVEKDIVLPPMTHRVVYLKPCWFDKMTANLFVQVLRANAVTSERSDVDYLFHKNSVKARHSLIRNLRQSNFTWTGFRLDDVVSTLETTSKYLGKDDKQCSPEDAASLLESSQIISRLATTEAWIALSRAHEVGMAVEHWPTESEEAFSLAFPMKPAMVGVTQLLDGQLYVDGNVLSENPADGLEMVGHTARARIEAMAEAENKSQENKDKTTNDTELKKTGVPSSFLGGQQPLTSRRATILTSKSSPRKAEQSEPAGTPGAATTPASPVRVRKRKLTLAEEQAELTTDSPLCQTRVVGTTSAKLTYLLDKVVQHQADQKIIIFYDGDNAAFYIAQCLEMMYINHRIYARTLDNVKRSEYVALFNEDPDVRVLLIDVACGALGLNLNAASVVLIVNPINRPGIEAQAIKRAHRIGQTRPVTVETLILENTIEHAIFNRAKKMSRSQHLEAKELEDDAGIVEIIQNAQVLPVLPEEEEGEDMFAKLQTPQQVFGRPGRHKFHRYGISEAKAQDKPRKKSKTGASSKPAKSGRATKPKKSVAFKESIVDTSPTAGSSASSFIDGTSRALTDGIPVAPGSIFGNG